MRIAGLALLGILLLSPARSMAGIDLHVRETDPTARTIITQPIEIRVPRASSCDNRTWTSLEKGMAVATTALILVDMSQTFSFTARGVGESNPLLPRHPSRWVLRGVTVGSIALYWGGSAYLDRPYRTIWQTTYLVLETGAVLSNQFAMQPSSGYAIPW